MSEFADMLLNEFVQIGNEYGFHSQQAHDFVLRNRFYESFVELALETYKNLHETSRLELVK